MALANTKPLKGLTRSTYCASPMSGTKSLCRRLSGHKGDCRPTLANVATPAAKGKRTKARRPKAVGVEVASADRYTVQPEPKARRTRKVRKLRYVAPKERIGVTGPVGQPKAAKRAKAAPLGTKSRSNANALRGRLAPKGA